MSHDRKIKHLTDRRIIYRRFPIVDKPTNKYDWGDYYENGTFECYELFRSKAKITTALNGTCLLYGILILN